MIEVAGAGVEEGGGVGEGGCRDEPVGGLLVGLFDVAGSHEGADVFVAAVRVGGLQEHTTGGVTGHGRCGRRRARYRVHRVAGQFRALGERKIVQA